MTIHEKYTVLSAVCRLHSERIGMIFALKKVINKSLEVKGFLLVKLLKQTLDRYCFMYLSDGGDVRSNRIVFRF